MAEHPSSNAGVPTFHEYVLVAAGEARRLIGRKPIDANTASDHRWRLSVHLLPFFGADRDRPAALRALQGAKLREADELRAAIASGAVLRDERGRKLQPLGLASLKKLLEAPAAILDEAIEDEHIDRNPDRSRRLRVRAPKPSRTFLEMDELAAFLDADDGAGPRRGRAGVVDGQGCTWRRRCRAAIGLRRSRASSELEARGLPPLPRTTPHTLRRTYISIALLANNFDVAGGHGPGRA